MNANPCLTCKFADWKRTASGRLHPSGDGRCRWQMPVFVIPKAFYWISHSSGIPKPSGGHIERNETQPIDCPAYEASS